MHIPSLPMVPQFPKVMGHTSLDTHVPHVATPKHSRTLNLETLALLEESYSMIKANTLMDGDSLKQLPTT